MSLRNDRDLANTREKLKLLEAHCHELRATPHEEASLRALTLQSLETLINEINQEVLSYVGRQTVVSA